jgi:hypothetical protein
MQSNGQQLAEPLRHLAQFADTVVFELAAAAGFCRSTEVDNCQRIGTRCFSSSCQFSTTTIAAGFRSAEMFLLTTKNRPSAATS